MRDGNVTLAVATVATACLGGGSSDRAFVDRPESSQQHFGGLSTSVDIPVGESGE